MSENRSYEEIFNNNYFIKQLFQLGDQKSISHLVVQADLATFETGAVHPFYATFALGRDVEWACRQFVLDMKDEDEEGIGTFLHINHRSPAMLGETVMITAEIILLENNVIDCKFEVNCKNRLIAEGIQGQKILKKEKLALIKKAIKNGR